MIEALPTPTAQLTTREAALEYARMGKRVFPVHWIENGQCSCGKLNCMSAGKHPMTRNGFKDASSNLTKVKAWWDKSPKANIGLPTGQVNGLIVIDVDVKNDGFKNFNRLQLKYGILNAAVKARTGGGGAHYMFKAPAGRVIKNSAGELAPGVDVRGEGGYIVAPPSSHRSGGVYEFEEGASLLEGVKLTELPELWVEALSSPAARDEKPAFQLPDVIAEGRRDRTVFELACSDRAKGMDMLEILEHLRQVNLNKCVPPLEDSQLIKIAKSADRFAPGTVIELSTAEEDFATEGFTINVLQTYKPDDFSDAGVAERFFRSIAGKLIWTEGSGYLRWTGTDWAEDPNAAVRAGVAHTDRMLEEAKRELVTAREKATSIEVSQQATDSPDSVKDPLSKAKADVERAEKYFSFVLKSRAYQRIKAFTELAKPNIAVASDRLDADPFALNTPAGIINLCTGEMLPHDPAALCTSITTVSPSGEGWDLWVAQLHTVTSGDEDLKRFLQYMAGMFLIGRVYCENLIIALGGGKNGKSTFFNALLAVLGPGYACTLNPEVLTADKRNAGADLATLRGKRLAILGETDEGKSFSNSILKRLTSTDPITAERKYFAPETFMPTHSAVLYTNFMPRLKSIDTGTTRRLRVVPFNASISDSSARMNYTQFLVDNAGGAVLAWMIKGAEMFIKNGCQLPSCRAVEEASAKYVQENDWMSGFLDDCCAVGAKEHCFSAALYSAYTERANHDSEYVRRMNDLAAELRKRGFTSRKTQKGVLWEGLSVRPNWKLERYYGAD